MISPKIFILIELLTAYSSSFQQPNRECIRSQVVLSWPVAYLPSTKVLLGRSGDRGHQPSLLLRCSKFESW